MPGRVSKEETRTFSRQDEKLRAIKDLKMPMARFMNGILIGQAMRFIPRATAAWSRMRFPSHYGAVGGQIRDY